MTRIIDEREHYRLEAITEAAESGTLGLIVTAELATGIERVLLAAFVPATDGTGDIITVPLAVMIDGDPTTLYARP